ncbi:hypothetical protein SAMN05421752_12818 [Natronorubrum thiooxidans]|uniref:Uncharacterized protein n=1 Tax=Natronorubrum thiooxidans TaxID=308853 RepID=A0A1N7H708_9EURY|nr:hypothetical protein SAMN05421752_12818 [Natronorubrum thiooxidans]
MTAICRSNALTERDETAELSSRTLPHVVLAQQAVISVEIHNY